MSSRFMRRIKRLPDGRTMLNVGCGWHTHPQWSNLDFGPYARLRRRPLAVWCLRALGIATDKRLRRLEGVDPDIIVWDVRRGLPFPDQTFDVVYHSNLVEHLRPEFANRLMLGCHRILKEGGILRVVTPDLGALARKYLARLGAAVSEMPGAQRHHEVAVEQLLGQLVVDEAEGRKSLPMLPRVIEGLVRGNASAVGERHCWAYDRISLVNLLRVAGFESERILGPNESSIENWSLFGLDVDAGGKPRHADCLYVEGIGHSRG